MFRATKGSFQTCKRYFNQSHNYDALVLGAVPGDTITFSASMSASTHRLLQDQLRASRFKPNDVRTFYNMGGMKQVAVVGLADTSQEAVRKATALGVRTLTGQGATRIAVDDSLDAQGASEGATLSLFSYDDFKSKPKEKVTVGPYGHVEGWEKGQIYGDAQNVARRLMTTPGNWMTPTLFAEEASKLLEGLDVYVRDEAWVAKHNMNAFLAVAKGSAEPLKFLEIHYRGKEERPYALVGKGVTFDAGGISLKPAAHMDLMKGDMGGAATVIGALYGISKLKLPIHVVATIPLCENLPSGTAVKPGDVIKAMNGKSIEILDTDAEGRLILADALYYTSSKYNPKSLIDLATLTGAMDVALGNVFAGVFTNSNELWQELEKAGQKTSDPFWRMPLTGYLEEMQESCVADLNNLGQGRSGGACSAAAFLEEFVHPTVPWAHIDIAGVMDSTTTQGYHIKGMSGRPTRSLIEYLSQQQ